MPGKQTHNNAYSNQPVILLLRSDYHGDVEVVRRRLATFFEVTLESVLVRGANGLYGFYLPGSYIPTFTPEVYWDSSSFTATASPILDPAVVSDPTGAALNNFAKNVHLASEANRTLPTPMSVFHADFDSGVAWALNDTFGLGRIYSTEEAGRAAVSNNIAAAALTRKSAAVPNNAYWDSYYTSGGAVGDMTYIREVSRAPGGSKIVLSRDRVTSTKPHSLESLLIASKDRAPDYSSPIEAATDLMDAAKPFFSENLSIGLSGGRDSRLVTALALKSRLDFKSFTAVPPMLEADIARQLHERSRDAFVWEVRDSSRRGSNDKPAEGIEAPVPAPIIERAEAWFEFTGGDNWSTYVRKAPVRRTPIRLNTMALSGAFGDFTRGHYYTAMEAERNDPESAIRRFHRSFMSIRRFIPEEVRQRGTDQIKATFGQMNEKGFDGFQSLDLSFLVNRMRRQLPHPAPNTLLPLLTPQMVSEIFWNDPGQKLNAQGLREMTNKLMPEWSDVPYFHEAAVGTDPAVTNKVTIQPTYWEVDEADFLQSVEYSLAVNDFIHLDMDRVRQEIIDLPEGRNRTNVTFEYIFWHAGATALLRRISCAQSGIRL